MSSTYWEGSREDDYARFDHFADIKEAQCHRAALLRRWHLERRLPWRQRVTGYFSDLSRIHAERSRNRDVKKRQIPAEFDRETEPTHSNDTPYSRLRTHCDGYYDDQEALWHWWRSFRIGKDFHGFMSLPSNVRLMIYGLLLVRDFVFINVEHAARGAGIYENRLSVYNWTDGLTPTRMRTRFEGLSCSRARSCNADGQEYDYKNGDGNTVALLQGVSKHIQHEAESVFWGIGNEFIFPIGKFLHPRGFWNCDCNLITFKNIRNVNIAFDAHDVGLIDFVERTKLVESLWEEEMGSELLVDLDLHEEVHHSLAEEALEIWRMRIRVFTQLLSLHTLKLDLEECYCPMRCCRLVKDVFEQAHLDFGQLIQGKALIAAAPQNVEVYGAKNEDERELIRWYFEQRGTPGAVVSFRPAFMSHCVVKAVG